MSARDIAHQCISELRSERSEILDRLMEARRIISSQGAILEHVQKQARLGQKIYWGETACETVAEAQAFIDAGLFGTKEKVG